MEPQYQMQSADKILCKVTLRRPMRLEGWSPLLQLVRHGWYAAAHPVTTNSLRNVYAAVKAAARTGDCSALDGTELVLSLTGEERRLPVSLANSQFVALDPTLPSWRFGYEPEITALLDLLVPDRGVFFDVGANWGYFGLFLASRPGFEGRVHAFEPGRHVFADLQRLVRGCGLEGVVTGHNLAVSDAAGHAYFSEAVFSGESRMDAGTGREKVATVRLDDLTLPAPDFIKIDVEGAEASVLAGASNLLKTTKPMVLFENWLTEGRVQAAPFDVLSQLGYRFYMPAWRGDNPRAFSLMPVTDRPEQVLALFPFGLPERAGLPVQMNVFACHADRIGELSRRG